jgi:pyruvate dehydrogenase complex dehydrogenase (E1) component
MLKIKVVKLIATKTQSHQGKYKENSSAREIGGHLCAFVPLWQIVKSCFNLFFQP